MYFLASFAAVFCILIQKAFSCPAEDRLSKDLLQNYNKISRPVLNPESVVLVSMGMSLLQIIEVNEKRQILTSNIWLMAYWTDERLAWNKSEYQNISQIRIPLSRIWSPDLHLQNGADEGASHQNRLDLNAVILSTGYVTYIPPLIVKTTCKMDVSWFPFDEQKCELRFGSWTYSALQIDLKLEEKDPADKNGYIKSGDWQLMNFSAKRSEKYYPCCKEPYVTVSFFIHIKRQSMYYFYTLIVPCALIGFLALFGFTLPPDSSEKMTLGVTVLFSLIVFLNLVAESMPANSDGVPLIGTYFNCVMFMIASSVISTLVINLNLKFLDTPKDVGWLGEKILFNWLPWLMHVKAPRNDKEVMDQSHCKGKRNKGYTKLELKQKWTVAAFAVDRLCLIVSIVFAVGSTFVLLLSTH